MVDFDRVEGQSTGFVLKHVRGGNSVFRGETESAGFKLIPTRKPPTFKENVFLGFKRS